MACNIPNRGFEILKKEKKTFRGYNYEQDTKERPLKDQLKRYTFW
jgi:hypothetical protein